MSARRNSRNDHSTRPTMRLQRFLAAAGVGSRRHCEEYITAGRVTVDGQTVDELGARVDPESQTVRLDGEIVRPEPKRYYLVHKPAGVVCTNRDPAGRPRAVDLVPQDDCRLFTVGRLDENSEGLLLITNDGELAQRLAHPRYGVRRTYRVQVVGKPTRETLDKLRRGLTFAEGQFRVQKVRRLGTKGSSTFLELTLTEGQNREIRRLFARVGHKVLKLERIAFGPLALGRLPKGRFRPLKPGELKTLREFVSSSAPSASSGRSATKKQRAKHK